MTLEALYTSIGEGMPGTVRSQMFGKPCFKTNGKAFVCFFENQMVFKLTGDHHAEALSLDGSQLFDPSGKGRAMKEWVQVPSEYQERWADFAHQAKAYVESVNRKS